MKTKKAKKLIGLTGLYCAGKSYVALELNRRGLPVLDVDKLAHQIVYAEKERLTVRFGRDILDASGGVDRKRLGAKVFGDPAELLALESIIHPTMNREIMSWVNTRRERACFINAALLNRTSIFSALDAVIIVRSSFPVRLLRAKNRDRLPLVKLLQRFASQSDFTSKYFSGNADTYTVENSCFSVCAGSDTCNTLENQINEILSCIGIG